MIERMKSRLPPDLSSKSRIGNLELRPSAKEFGVDEPVSFVVSLKVLGAIRDTVDQHTWEEAYDHHDIDLRVTYHLAIKTGILKFLMKPQKFVKRAKFYWSRNPDNPSRVWAMIIDEERNPNIPVSEEDALSRLFSISRSFRFLGLDLGKGKHKIFATAEVKWGRHVFVEHGSVSAKSDPVTVICQ